MALQFILGPPGTGKSTRCLKEIESNLPGGTPLYYLVPEQFSLQSERLLAGVPFVFRPWRPAGAFGG
jgi:ATP-dependent helicase/DNAse subunit B